MSHPHWRVQYYYVPLAFDTGNKRTLPVSPVSSPCPEGELAERRIADKTGASAETSAASDNQKNPARWACSNWERPTWAMNRAE